MQSRIFSCTHEVFMKKEVLHKVIYIIIVVFCVIAISTIINFEVYKKPLSPQKVYLKSLKSVVELKASSDDIGESYGSAIFINLNGNLVTNAHVVTYEQMGFLYTFSKYEIRFANETKYHMVELVRYDEQNDLALLKIMDNCDFEPISLGDSNEVMSGDTVYAVGNALNHGISISKGIASIPILKIEYEGSKRVVLQCDLTISEGNSGGALINEQGELIGITTFRTKDNMGYVVYGVAYCIPVNVVTSFVEVID